LLMKAMRPDVSARPRRCARPLRTSKSPLCTGPYEAGRIFTFAPRSDPLPIGCADGCEAEGTAPSPCLHRCLHNPPKPSWSGRHTRSNDTIGEARRSSRQSHRFAASLPQTPSPSHHSGFLHGWRPSARPRAASRPSGSSAEGSAALSPVPAPSLDIEVVGICPTGMVVGVSRTEISGSSVGVSRTETCEKPGPVFCFLARADRATVTACSLVLMARHSSVAAEFSVWRKVRRKRFGRRNSRLPPVPRSVTSTNPRATSWRMAGAIASRSTPNSSKCSYVHGRRPLSLPPCRANSTSRRSSILLAARLRMRCAGETSISIGRAENCPAILDLPRLLNFADMTHALRRK
jgi:hypothetical protein